MRVLWGCLAATVIAPIAGVLFLVMIPVWRDNDRLADFHERVLAHPLPPETRSRDNGQAAFGKMSGGSGDYCEYQVRLTLETSLSQEAIRDYYDQASLRGVHNKAQVSLRSSGSPGGRRTVIVEFGDISPSDWDWRCA